MQPGWAGSNRAPALDWPQTLTGVRNKLQRTTSGRVGLCPARGIEQKDLEATAWRKLRGLITWAFWGTFLNICPTSDACTLASLPFLCIFEKHTLRQPIKRFFKGRSRISLHTGSNEGEWRLHKKKLSQCFFSVSPSKFQALPMMHLDRCLRGEALQTTTGF